jgi:hypothetical protein
MMKIVAATFALLMASMVFNMPVAVQGTDYDYPAGLEFISFDIFHAVTDTKIATLTDGAVIKLEGQNPRMNKDRPDFNIVARTDPNVPKVIESGVFQLDSNKRFRVENVAGYWLCGNNGMDFFSCGRDLGCGEHTVTAIPWTEDDGRGKSGKPLTVKFTIDCGKY